jgi:hypothetical protein
MTQRSFDNMLNPYASLQMQKEQAQALTSKRERVRNVLIDQLGRKPTEDEIDAALIAEEQGQISFEG